MSNQMKNRSHPNGHKGIKRSLGCKTFFIAFIKGCNAKVPLFKKGRMDKSGQKVNVCFDTSDVAFIKSLHQPPTGKVTIRLMNNQLRNKRVIIGSNSVAFFDPTIQPHPVYLFKRRKISVHTPNG